MITTDSAHPYFSMATMLIDTNDCFGGFNFVEPKHGMVLYSPGYDSGTEVNDESCNNIPGPGCANLGDQIGTDFNADGEGYIHIHRGIHGVGDLDESVSDWRNPVLKIEITRV